MNELETLAQAMAALEAQRALLGDVTVEAALGPMREKLAALRGQAAPPPGQRKHVTVLFADVSGFTALSAALDFEDVRDTMDALWLRLDAAITAHGGKIDKHLGDGVMALWGAETAREDDPERAIHAALAMQSELRAFAATQRHALQMRIGINTGLVFVGSVGSTREFTAMGDTVNVAARLERAAPVGGVLIAHDTYRHVRGVFDVTAQPPLVVKGKSEPLQTYCVQQAKPRAFRMVARGVEGVETRLVGRAAEMAQLQEAFHQVLRGRVTRAFTVVGEAGLGKSRLLQEFIHWAEVTGSAFTLFRGRAVPSTGDAPYALLRDVLALRFEIQESDALETARAKLEAGMAALCPADPQVQEKAHFIGHLAGWDFSAGPYLRGLVGDAPQIRAIALHFLTLFFHGAATARPAVLLLEDLHWADRASLDALRHVLGNLPPGTPLLILANARPSLFERAPAWDLAAQTRIDLRPLSAADSAALVEDILRHVPELPAGLRDMIVRQAEGNPFYVEELIKMLIDEKVIRPGASEWRVQTERLATLHVPPTLTGVLQARLDGLPGDERLALQRAAVMGRTFWDTAVQALGEEAQALADVQAQLDSARRRELVYPHAPAFTGTHEYLFKHALLRDVAYETVLKRERAAYHARAARWLEAVSGARRREYLTQIAEHYERAGNPAEAGRCFEQAGDAATRVSALADAVNFYTRVSAPSAALYTKLAEAHYQLGNFAAARAALEQALALATCAMERAAALAFLAEMTSQLGDYAGAEAILAEAVPLARTSGDRLTLCRALYSLGDVCWRLARQDEARVALEESLALARALEDVTRELFALNRLGAVALLQEDFAEARRLFGEVHARALAAGNRERAMTALNNLGVVLTRMGGNDQAARDRYREALALAREVGAQEHIVTYLLNLAECDLKLGALADARAELREGLPLALRVGAPSRVVAAVKSFAGLAYGEGRIDRALALFGLARRHPAWFVEHERQMEMTLARSALDPVTVAAGLARGADLDWDATLAELLAE